MTTEQMIVLALPLLPLLGAVACWLMGPKKGPAIRAVAVAVSLACLGLAIALTVSYLAVDRSALDDAAPGFYPEFVPGSTAAAPRSTTWNIVNFAGGGAIQFYFGIDGLNIWLVALTALLILPCVLVSFKQITSRVHEYYAWLLLLQTTMLGVFLSFDIVLFYVFFEAGLVPLFFLIGIWGGAQRQDAARKFVIFTLTGSLLTLLGVLSIVLACYAATRELSFSIPHLVKTVNEQLASPVAETRAYWIGLQGWAFLALCAGFAVKVPLMPVHTWLPLAHTEAPTAGSVSLAGVMLKLGSYGFLRLCIPLCPDAAWQTGVPLITGLAALGVVYGAFVAFAQDDIKRLIAYSSVSHLGLCMLGMFSLTLVGMQGSMMEMINHGLSTSLLFLLFGMLYERYHTRKMADYSGMAGKMPLFGFFMVFACLSSVGLPLLNGFVGEVLCLSGIYEHEATTGATRILPLRTLMGTSGMILGAWYLFTLLRKVVFGPTHEPHHEGEDHPPIRDLDAREWGLLLPLAVLCVVIGFWPAPILKSAEPDMKRIVSMVERAKVRAADTRRVEAKP